MNLLPCREALLEVIDVYFHQQHHRSTEATNNNNQNREEECCWRFFRRYNSIESVQDTELCTEDEIFELHRDDDECESLRGSLGSVTVQSVILRHDPIQSDYVFRNTCLHYGSTVLITFFCYLGAVAVSGVAAVWSFIGSSMAFAVAFILPCSCFIVLEGSVPSKEDGGDRHQEWISIAWAIGLFSIVGVVVCTINNTVGFGL